MKIKLKVLSPVHIGSGEEISTLEYIISKDNIIQTRFIGNANFIRLDMEGIFNDPQFKPLMNKFIESVKTARYISEILPHSLLLKHQLYSINISDVSPIGLHAVKSFIKSAGRVYIPGSSLKGSILSAVMRYILKRKNIKNLQNYRELLDLVLSEVSINPPKNQPTRFAKWLNVTDSNFKTPEESLQISVAKLVGARRELLVVYETLKENIEFEMEISTSLPLNSTKYSWCKMDEKQLLSIANEFYRKVYEKEREFKVQSLPQISDDTILLRIGQGSTAWSTSFFILAEELNIKGYDIQRPGFSKITGQPRTRKLITGTKSMGWVEVRYA